MKRPTTSTPFKEAKQVQADSAALAAEQLAATINAHPRHQKAVNEADLLPSLAAKLSSMVYVGSTPNGATKLKNAQTVVNTTTKAPIRETHEGDADSERGTPPWQNRQQITLRSRCQNEKEMVDRRGRSNVNHPSNTCTTTARPHKNSIASR